MSVADTPYNSGSYSSSFQIGAHRIGAREPTYFIADIAANHDGSLQRARELIWRCREAGADAVKFQHFQARTIVSDYGFRRLGGALGHQAKWGKPVYDVYAQYELNRGWTQELADTARAAEVDFLTTPYDFAAIERVGAAVPAFKIGSGDIDWLDFIRAVAHQGKPVLLACGAAEWREVQRAVDVVLTHNPQLALMQCNTNYTGSLENLHHVNLRVLEAFARRWPGLPLGLSDHTPGHATVLGAIALGARVVEKHFTDDNARAGPDHPFSMTPAAWSQMVQRTRELESALGDGVKRVQDNEREARIIQRRCIRLARDLPAGMVLKAEDLECLRPAELGALGPDHMEEVLGATLRRDMSEGEALRTEDLLAPLPSGDGRAERERSCWAGTAMLSGEHVALRAIERADLPTLLAWRNDPRLRRFFRERRELSMDDQRAWYERTVIGPGKADTRMFAIQELHSGELVGACGLCYIDWVDRTAELSLYIGRDALYIDEQLAPAAARVLVAHAFDDLGLHRLWVEVYAYDTPKRDLLLALGFALEGTLREHRFREGERHDSLMLGRVRAG